MDGKNVKISITGYKEDTLIKIGTTVFTENAEGTNYDEVGIEELKYFKVTNTADKSGADFNLCGIYKVTYIKQIVADYYKCTLWCNGKQSNSIHKFSKTDKVPIEIQIRYYNKQTHNKVELRYVTCVDFAPYSK